MTEEKSLAKRDTAAIMESVIAKGNLADLTPQERTSYYMQVCESLGVNPLTKPFAYLELDGKLVLYALRDCTDQLRATRRINVTILNRERLDDVYLVTARAQTPDGRTDESIGVVPLAKEDGTWETNERSGKRYFRGNGTFKPLHGDALANALMKCECVPMDTEMLTRDGFKAYDDLIRGEEVLAYDTEADECKWTPLLETAYYSRAWVFTLHTADRQFDVSCTHDHSWAIRSKPYAADQRGDGSRGPRGPYANRKSTRRLVKACDLKAGQSVIMAAPEKELVESILTPVEAAILGWAVTDGTIKRVGNSVRIGICQSKSDNFDAIRETVGVVASNVPEHVSPSRTRTFPTGRTYDTQEQHWWYIPAAISRSILDRAGFHDRCDLPRIVTRLSSPARKAMLQAMMLAEGDKHNIFANTDKHIHDAFDILCALEGHATGRLTHKADSLYTKRLKKTRHVAGQNLTLERFYESAVWCPTTQYGTWVMRQHGQVCITGNTKAKRRVTLSIVGLGWLDETEIETISNARIVPQEVAEATQTATKTNGRRPSEPIAPEYPPTAPTAPSDTSAADSFEAERMPEPDDPRCVQLREDCQRLWLQKGKLPGIMAGWFKTQSGGIDISTADYETLQRVYGVIQGLRAARA